MKKALLISIVSLYLTATVYAQPAGAQWQGKRVAFLGDSMTQASRDGSETVYWQYLAEWLGIEPAVYGISGHQWTGIYGQAERLLADGTDVDAIFVFAGTNDFNHSVPLGEFFTETLRQTNHNGETVTRKYRTPIETDSTFCGRINRVLSFLKTHFPEQQIIVMTPVHRAWARFGDRNVQPEELFANGRGLYLDNYVETLKQASGYWSVPLIDLHALSGLYPLADSHAPYFRNTETDRLHLNSTGNRRLAETIRYQLLALPASFVTE
jgi:lysophospholipase L1-like esterase